MGRCLNKTRKADSSSSESDLSAQIIATSHDLTPKGGLVREIPLFQENLGRWNIFNLARFMGDVWCFCLCSSQRPHSLKRYMD